MFGCAAWDVRDLGVLGPVCVSSGRFAGVRGAGAVSVPACLLMPGGVTGAVSPTSSSDITTAVSGCVFCVCVMLVAVCPTTVLLVLQVCRVFRVLLVVFSC